jgi:hypothetical protein
MIERLGLATVPELESALRDLGSVVDMPPTRDLATAVGDRLRAMATAGPMPSAMAPTTIEPRRLPVIRSVRRSLLLAAAIAILVVGAALGVRFGLDLLEIEFGPVPSISVPPASVASPGASARPTPRIDAGARLSLGSVSTLEEAAADADFPLLVPDVLGPPDEVYMGGSALRGQVAFGYRPRADMPKQGLLAGLGLLVTQNRGEFDQGMVHKLIDTELGIVVPVDVDGAPGFWMAGAPHVFWYFAPDGTIIQESERRVGDTLAWERDGILYRIEGAASKERAVEIARSMRAP